MRFVDISQLTALVARIYQSANRPLTLDEVCTIIENASPDVDPQDSAVFLTMQGLAANGFLRSTGGSAAGGIATETYQWVGVPLQPWPAVELPLVMQLTADSRDGLEDFVVLCRGGPDDPPRNPHDTLARLLTEVMTTLAADSPVYEPGSPLTQTP